MLREGMLPSGFQNAVSWLSSGELEFAWSTVQGTLDLLSPRKELKEKKNARAEALTVSSFILSARRVHHVSAQL